MLPDPDGSGIDRTTAWQILQLPAIFLELLFEDRPQRPCAGFMFTDCHAGSRPKIRRRRLYLLAHIL